MVMLLVIPLHFWVVVDRSTSAIAVTIGSVREPDLLVGRHQAGNHECGQVRRRQQYPGGVQEQGSEGTQGGQDCGRVGAETW